MPARYGRIIAVTNKKGGIGKTATTVNLAAALAKKNHRVLIVDLDSQSNASKGLGIQIKDDMASAYDLLTKPASVSAKDTIQKTRWEGLHLIPSHADLAGAELELIHELGREKRLARALKGITADYDFILIDTPPRFSLLTINALVFATEVLVPCQTQPYAYLGLDDLFNAIFAVKDELNSELDVTGIVLTFYDKRTNVSQDIVSKIRNNERYRELLFNTVIRTNTTIAESTAAERPVVFFNHGCIGSKDYMNLAGELMIPVFL